MLSLNDFTPVNIFFHIMNVLSEIFDDNLLMLNFQFLNNVLCEILFDFSMPWNGLAGFCDRILIPIMSASMPDKNTPQPLNLFYQISSLHAISSSAT